MTRDWTRNKAIFGKGLSSTERYNLKKGLGMCTWPSCRNQAQDEKLTCRECRIKKKEVLNIWRNNNRAHVNEQAKKYKKPYTRGGKGLADWYSSIKSEFGWAKEKVNEVLSLQNNLCAICKLPNVRNWNLGLDHDHITEIPREFLCNKCNSVLGFVNDNIELLETMVAYLKKHKENPNVVIPYKTKNITGYKGVEKNHNKWAARIMVNKKRVYLGTFNTPEEAHQVYEAYVRDVRVEIR